MADRQSSVAILLRQLKTPLKKKKVVLLSTKVIHGKWKGVLQNWRDPTGCSQRKHAVPGHSLKQIAKGREILCEMDVLRPSADFTTSISPESHDL